jgi:hypothetical protein
MEIVLTLIFILFTSVFAFGQTKKAAGDIVEKNKRPIKVSLLSSYYEQDGERGAVNGGIGSQALYSFTQEGSIYIPVRDSSGIKLYGGVDHYTAASLLQIDKYQTSASTGTSNVSGDETRVYATVGYDFANKKKRTIITPSIGFSTEYDIFSMNAGLSYSKHFIKKGSTLTSSFNFIHDRWMVVYPGEFRASTNLTDTTTSASGSGGGEGSGGEEEGSGEGSGSGSGSGEGSGGSTGGENPGEGNGSGEGYYNTGYATPIPVTGNTITRDGKTYPVDHRYTYSLANVYAFPINKRMNATVGLDLIAQYGLLSTPFHRIYFNDGIADEFYKEVRIEHLPRQRYKVALSGRFNYFVHPLLVLRTQMRLYGDSWDIRSVSFNIDAPVKVTRWLTFIPFYRHHNQQGTKYYQGYGRHLSSDKYYTSDIDLADIASNKYGIGARVVPFANVGLSNEEGTKSIFSVRSIDLRYAVYSRSDGLKANMFSVGVDFDF